MWRVEVKINARRDRYPLIESARHTLVAQRIVSTPLADFIIV